MGEYLDSNSCFLSEAVQPTMMLIMIAMLIMLIRLLRLIMMIVLTISVISFNNSQAAYASDLTLSS